MKKICFIISILLSGINLNAQITFQKVYGGLSSEGSNDIEQTEDGGYVMAGSTDQGGMGSDVYLIKSDSIGNLIWSKTYGGVYDDDGFAVQQTADGGYIIAGETASFGIGDYDFYLVKTDSSGNLTWSKTFGGTDIDVARSVQQTTDGGYIVAGFTASFGAGNDDVFLVKTDSAGNLLWKKTFGGAGDDQASTVLQTMDGGYIVAGGSSLSALDAFLIKTDSIGNMLWLKNYDGPPAQLNYFSAVKQTTDGGYLIVGDKGFYMVKTDSTGNLLWTKLFETINAWSYARSARQTTDGGYILTGYTYNLSTNRDDICLVKTDSNGDSLWTKVFGRADNDFGNAILQTPDGGYIIAGSSRSAGVGNDDVYLIKTDSLGNSECNQLDAVYGASTPATSVSSPFIIVSSPPTAVSTSVTIVDSGCVVTTLCITGINELITNYSFFISPNPSSGNFIISFDKMIIKGNIEILNILGEKVFEENIFNESKKEINLKNSAAGIYLVKVFDGEKSYCRKLIVE